MKKIALILIGIICCAEESFAISKMVDYVTLSKQLANFNEVDVISNNLANGATPTFKEKRMLLRPYNFKTKHNDTVSFVNDYATYRNPVDGELLVTENTFDLSFTGWSGFFIVRTPNGENYTRYGNFYVSSEGVLVTKNGYSVLNEDREDIVIPITSNTQKILITEHGYIEVDGVRIAKIGVVKFANKDLLIELGGNYFKTSPGQEPLEIGLKEYSIMQGALEGSNVNKIQGLTNLMLAQRVTDQTMHLMNSYDDLTKSVINKLCK